MALAAAPSAIADSGGTNLPIKGTLSGPSVYNILTGTFVEDLTGTESHLGNVTQHNTGTVTPTGPTSFNITASGVTVAANGDELFGTFTGSETIDVAGNYQGQGVTTITGGTGRFAHASGVSTGSFTATPGTVSGTTLMQIITSSGEGTISY